MGSRGKEENAFVRLRASIEASREEGGYGGLGLPSWQTHLQKKWNRHRGQVLWNGSIGLWDQEDRWTVFPGIYNRSLLAFLGIYCNHLEIPIWIILLLAWILAPSLNWVEFSI